MKPTVLLYNFTDSKRKMKVQQALMPLGFRLRAVTKEEYGLPVGVLAGVKGLNEDVLKEAGQAIEAGEDDSSRKMDFSDEMAIMAGFSSAQIDAFIHALRKKGVGRIDYKAVLTPYNMKWDSVQLYEEIKKEHEMMTGKGKDEAL